MLDKLKSLFISLRSSVHKRLDRLKTSKFWQNPKFRRRFALTALLGFLLATGGIAFWVASLDVSKLESPLAHPTFIYDQKGNKVSQLSSSKIEPVSIDKVPLQMREAIIAVEDRRFYEHKGVDVWSILRALAHDLKSGDFSEGGSTITQQLAKNLFLPSDKTLRRKFKEAAYALKIELTLTKNQILESYLNHIYFGEGRWGIQNAARFYFGKNVQDLSLEEAALLASLPKAPSIYSPLKSKDKALERRNLVLSLMKEQTYISESEYLKAKAQPINLKKGPDGELSGKYAPYVDYVIEEAISRYGFTEDQILGSGLQIYTQMDQAVQKAAEDVYHDNRFFPPGKSDQIVQSGIAIIDQHNGGIRGLVGYRGESLFRGFDHATQLKRQPGSSFKPLSVYGPALEKGYIPYSILYDGPLNLNGYKPTDWDYQTRGYVTMQEALQNSWNIPAVWLLNEIGLDTGMAFAQRAGVPLTKEDRTLSLALGGLSTGVSPLQMAQAYSGFANLGVMNKAYAITKITTFDGYVLTQAKPEAVKITDQSTAYTMTFLLKNVVDNGTGKNAAFGRPTAGKTGSVELPHTKEFAGIKGVKDVWFVGYTPELTAAIWMGYDKTDREHYLTISGGSGPAVVFREVLSRALSNKPVVPFKIPSNYWLNSGKMYPSFTDEKDDKKPDRNNESLNNFGIDPNFFNSWLNPGETDKFPSKGKGKKR
ncbi:transglycosylase domain-containing protein [Desulfosporosinus sp. BICA1-9]|uniref:transglycosylase domain-containing protein n=1 Tax=Desulfosporosinus sp. BICA1-9 TaxID=1531958 RepID=UPI0005F0F0A7|nr:PBP1A family penicillin-binding protein [Desulfosporosinus sp. BICA1-9]KJS50133.1 MAG: penicillin-binding protein [Peptococcaceae bacterium BRH_c23]KJS84505.1 MAG: penicillin-binding protein [Desulfosporosinus sp. BICA1-9]HBW35014.1 PBP1A family penicillin-binding protein [Desulfosporosinus sp.]